MLGKLGRHFPTSTKKVIEQFADDFGLVYFGHVDQHRDDHELVRGVTVSADHNDSHYCVGTIQDYDVVLVQRTDKLTFPGKPTKSYTWMIMQFDLKTASSDSRHIFLDAHHHDETFYAHLFTKFNRLHKVNSELLKQQDPRFAASFDVYAPPDDEWLVTNIFTRDIAATLGHHFQHFDFEITGDHLLVYTSSNVITRNLLEYLTRAGVWLAEHIDSGVTTTDVNSPGAAPEIPAPEQ